MPRVTVPVDGSTVAVEIKRRGEIDGVGDDRDLGFGNPARHHVALQALADRGDARGAPERVGFERAREAVPDTVLAAGAMVDGRVLPECAHLVKHGDSRALAHSQSRQRVEHRGVRVEDVRFHLLDDSFEPALRCAHSSLFYFLVE